MILAIDTSAGQCAVALLGARTHTRVERMSRGHAEALFPMIDAVLAEAKVGYRDVSRIGVCTGPGSFTGLRVGIAAARGLALSLGIPAVGVSRLETLGAGWTGHVVLKGRGETLFAQCFQAGVPTAEPFVTDVLPGGVVKGDGGLEQTEDDGLVDVVALAKIAVSKEPGPRPAPLYMRPADAAPSRDVAPVRLDG